MVKPVYNREAKPNVSPSNFKKIVKFQIELRCSALAAALLQTTSGQCLCEFRSQYSADCDDVGLCVVVVRSRHG